MQLAITIARRLLTITVTILLAAFLAACLVRVAPGFASDSSQLDPRLTSESIRAVRAERTRNSNVAAFYTRYLAEALRGDLGHSQLFRRPVTELISERAAVTAQLIILGLLFGWILALALAAAVVLLRNPPVDLGTALFAGIFLCLPAAVIALAFVMMRAPAWLAIALVVFPRLFTYTRNLLMQAQHLPHVVTAHAKGLHPVRVFARHVLPLTAFQTIALAGVSASMAIGASIPVESLLSIPGLGHLAWEAAMARDLPLLVGITLVVSTCTILANALADLLSTVLRPQHNASRPFEPAGSDSPLVGVMR